MIEFESNEYMRAIIFQLNKDGNSCCGDSYFISADDEGLICAVADGLGSGKAANESSSIISEIVEKYSNEEVAEIIERCNVALRSKRGATVSVLKFRFVEKDFTYCSVGNVRFILYSPSGKCVYPLPVGGYLSGKPRKYKTQTYEYEPGSKFIIYTDGLEVPTIRSYLKSDYSIEHLSKQLDIYTRKRNDDLTYILGQLL
ncbi:MULTISPECIES: PP2C family serine/threonine-protein phosphatase [Bacillus]|uniref:Phosphoserine phosphatase n=2 Tax=Bacillus TaxID=1386 RepID=A0A0M4FMX2_9BACI|nr:MULTISPECIES: PP2C family serine/threonine-protein phosphatase [Bacillus]ALC83817.1 phosphoserine phosphatase [Bacillus gobiensis]MBP1084049.1 negative regulator of sigma-B (phosphoserine phosphatase) [Bacillus capparidis]MED1096907.1 PP2C family serine/threonine-protein phosphatase [Bacillus capparidis]